MVTASTGRHLEAIAEQGFTVVSDVFSPAHVQAMRAALEDIFAREEGALSGHGEHVRFSVNLTNKHAAFREAVQNPVLIDLLVGMLGDDFILGSFHARATYPGAPLQRIHRDWMLDRRIPFPTHVNSMWMLDDFTEENGATRIVPGSHLWDSEPEADHIYPEVQATGSAGSVAVFDSRVFHAGGANRSIGQRRGLTGFFCRSWARGQEDHTRCIDPSLLEGASPLLIRLWGFQAQVPWEDPDQPNVMRQLPAPGVPELRPV